MAEDIKIFWRRLILKLRLKESPMMSISQGLKGDFDMYIGGFDFDPRYDMRKLFDKSGSIGYSNEDVISLVNKMEFCLQPEDRRANYRSFIKSYLMMCLFTVLVIINMVLHQAGDGINRQIQLFSTHITIARVGNGKNLIP